MMYSNFMHSVSRKLTRSFSQKIFNRNLKQKHREFALGLPDGAYYDYLREESASNIIDRVEDITRSFPKALEIGSYRGSLHSIISSRENLRGPGGVGGITELIQAELASNVETMVKHPHASDGIPSLVQSSISTVDEEDPLPYADHTFDLVLSSLSMHWVNNLPGALLEVKRILRPDGAFIASMFGGNTLTELRNCFYLAEQERKGGMSSHCSPLAKASDVAGLMQGAGFALPTVDIDTVTISYPSAIALMEHLQYMGEGNAAIGRQFHVGRDVFLAAAAIYQALYGLEDGSVEATFEIIYMIGWSPDSSQPQACRRGSAQVSMKELGKSSV